MTLLAKKLIQLNLSQNEIADKVGVSQPYVSAVLKGKVLKYSATKKFAEAFGFNLMELVADFDHFENTVNEPSAEYNKKDDAMDQLQRVQKSNGKRNSDIVLTEDDLVPQKVITIPIDGFAGLQNAFFAEDYINANFKEVVEMVRPEEKIIGPYFKIRIKKDNRSMENTLSPLDWTYNEAISEQDWSDAKTFKKDKVYCLWHPKRGILFKRISKFYDLNITLSSDNPDKTLYADEDFYIGEFKKILVVRKKETVL